MPQLSRLVNVQSVAEDVPFNCVRGSKVSVTVAIVVFAVIVMAATLASFVWRANYRRHHLSGQPPGWMRWVMAVLVLTGLHDGVLVLLATYNEPVTAGRVITMIVITAAAGGMCCGGSAPLVGA